MRIVKLLLFTGFSLCIQASQAQIAKEEMLGNIGQGSLENLVSAKATSGTGSRMISYTHLLSDAVNYVYHDSTSLAYSGTRGGDYPALAYEVSKYDNLLYLSYNTSTSTFDNNQKGTQTFDANNDPTNLLYMQWDVPSSSWVNTTNVIYTYDGMNNRLTRIAQAWSAAWLNQSKITYTYDANNNVSTNLLQGWNNATMAWVNSTKTTNLYNAGNKITQAFEQHWNTVTVTWDNYSRLTYTYDANNNNLTQLTENWNTGNNAWDNSQLITNTYNASNQKLTKLTQYWNGATNQWGNNRKDIFADFDGINAKTDTVLTWNNVTSAYENSKRYLYTFNSYGQYLSSSGESWNVGGFWQPVAGDYGYRFHYEEYATDVKDLSSNGGKATIYPVPANNVLNIDLNWDEPQAFTLSIIDLQGRVSSQRQVAATAQYHNSIDVSTLPFGTYFIKIDGTKGQVIKQLIVSPR